MWTRRLILILALTTLIPFQAWPQKQVPNSAYVEDFKAEQGTPNGFAKEVTKLLRFKLATQGLATSPNPNADIIITGTVRQKGNKHTVITKIKNKKKNDFLGESETGNLPNDLDQITTKLAKKIKKALK